MFGSIAAKLSSNFGPFFTLIYYFLHDNPIFFCDPVSAKFYIENTVFCLDLDGLANVRDIAFLS